MTKSLSNQEKKAKKDARKQQKATSTTSTHVNIPKHEEGPAEPPADPVNLCDVCAYEFGECEGKPKLASDTDDTLTGAAADRVIACEGFLNVEKMPTADQAKKDAAAEQPRQGEGPDAAHDGDDEGPGEAEEEEPGETEKLTPTDELPYRPAAGPNKPDPKRFQKEEDFGACPSCNRPLKRTSLNRYIDAIRCTNPRCRAYRSVVKTLSTGVK